jgi:hypothetical protein
VLLFGVGMLVGAAIANSNSYHDPYYYYRRYGWPPPATLYPYGAARHYSYARGGYYSTAHAYGPYGSAGIAHNPSTGGVIAYRKVATPYGSAGGYAAYNPYTGTVSRGGYTSNGQSARYAQAAYNPYTNTSVARAGVTTPQGSATRGFVQQGDQWARGGTRSNSQGAAAAVQTSKGAAAAGISTNRGNAVVAQTKNGDFYVGRDGNVYKRGADGGWAKNTGNGWETTSKSKPGDTATTRKPAAISAATKPPQSAAAAAQRPVSPARQFTGTPNFATTRPAAPIPDRGGTSISNNVQSQLSRDSAARQRGQQMSVRGGSGQPTRVATAGRGSGR